MSRKYDSAPPLSSLPFISNDSNFDRIDFAFSASIARPVPAREFPRRVPLLIIHANASLSLSLSLSLSHLRARTDRFIGIKLNVNGVKTAGCVALAGGEQSELNGE